MLRAPDAVIAAGLLALAIACAFNTVPASGAQFAEASATSADERGLTMDTAIVLGGASASIGDEAAEHAYTDRHYAGWAWEQRSLMHDLQRGRTFDKIRIRGPNGQHKTLYFDVSE